MRAPILATASRLTLVFGLIAAPAVAAAQTATPQQTTPLPQSVPSAASGTGEAGQDGLADIVVTAQKRAENLQRVPIAVDVLDTKALVSSGVVTTTDLSAAVPGLSFRDTYGQVQPHLRGVGTTFAGPGQENAVAFYVDDVYYSSAIATALTLSDVNQVAVLKGPQGTLFGRNANGGVIQVTTRDPQHEFEGSIATSLDNYLTSTSDLYLTGGLSSTVSANLAVQFTTQGKGWGHNLANGDEVHKTDHNIALRQKTVFELGPTTVKAALDFTDRRDSGGPNFIPFPGTTSLYPGQIKDIDPWDVNSSITNRNSYTGWGGSLTIDHDAGIFHIISISAYRGDRLTTQFDPTATPTPANGIFIHERTNQVTQEIRLVSPKDDKFSWAAGLFGFYGNGKDEPLGVTLNPAITSFPAPSGGPTVYIAINARETTLSGAAYAQGTLLLWPGTHLTAGLRYTVERRTYSASENQEIFFAGPILLGPPTTAPDLVVPVVANPPLPPSEHFGRPTWRLALDHQFGSDILGYVSYNRGFKSGGFNTQNPVNQPYLPETVDAYEVGLKSQSADHRLRLNVAGFYNKYKDVQIETFTNVAFFQNGASAKTYGVDLDVEIKPSRAFLIAGGLEWVHATYTSFPGANFYQPLPGGGANPYTADAAGKFLPNAPQFTGDLSLTYTRTIGDMKLDANVSNSFSSRYYQEPDNLLSQKPYDLLSASVGLTTAGDRVTIRLWAKNLLNEAVIGQMSTNPFGGTNVGFNADYSSPPRTYGASIKYNF